jgi:membrane-associated protein
VELLHTFVDIVLHLDVHLAWVVQNHGVWVYGLLFLIIFCETGLVVTPFLPGDSLLFATGTLAATGALEISGLLPLLMLASFLGDNCNYWIGHFLGPRLFKSERSRLFNRRHLDETHAFYVRHGAKAVLLARFFPIVRTFAPFVAGMGRMDYRKFLSFSLGGAVAWVGSIGLAGFFFGNIPVVKQNFTVVLMGIILVSLLPAFMGYLRRRKMVS